MAVTPTVDILWPESLPLPLIDAGGKPNPATLVSPKEESRIQRRRRFYNSVPTMEVRWCLTIAQMDAFEVFFFTTLFNGVAQFLIDLKYPKTSAVSPWVVRFLGGYASEYKEGMWDVVAQLELTKTEMTELAPLIGWVNFLVEQPGLENDPDSDVPFETVDGFIFNVKV